MKNLYRRSDRRGTRWLFIASSIVGLLFLIDIVSGGWLRGGVRAASASLWSVGRGASSAIFESGFLSSRRALIAENESLKGKVAELTLRAAEATVFEEEAMALRALARLAESEEGITAPVVSSVRSSLYGTFLIGAGTEDGVEVGDLVLAGDGARSFVVGRVREAEKGVSLVGQIFAPDVSTEAVIGSATLMVEGRGGGNARTTAPEALAIEVGDTVIGREFYGRPIGIVGAISHNSASATDEIFIQLPIGLAALTFVYVIPLGP